MKEIIFMLSFLMYAYTMTLSYAWGNSTTPSAVTVDELYTTTWKVQINQLANNQQSPAKKAEATEKLASEYEATLEEMEEFKVHVLNEFLNLRYLSDGSNAEYMLGNMFQAIVLEHHDVPAVRDFAEAFYHNTKNVFTEVTEPESDLVQKYEEQMFKAINTKE
ncbi:hypothetical protein [Paenibacillus sp. FSL K6-0108]|uniref:hypothetical protein n=1 Tax=Paenibacillus sp. FSL K6-0108 TaxID=2921417 RepID=UPI0032452058